MLQNPCTHVSPRPRTQEWQEGILCDIDVTPSPVSRSQPPQWSHYWGRKGVGGKFPITNDPLYHAGAVISNLVCGRITFTLGICGVTAGFFFLLTGGFDAREDKILRVDLGRVWRGGSSVPSFTGCAGRNLLFGPPEISQHPLRVFHYPPGLHTCQI